MNLRPVSEAGSGAAREDEKKRLSEIVEKINDRSSGNFTEADMVGYVTTIKGKLLENETLAKQAEANIEEQFALGNFKGVLTDIVLDSQDAQSNVADHLLKDERILAAVRGMPAKMVYQSFSKQRSNS